MMPEKMSSLKSDEYSTTVFTSLNQSPDGYTEPNDNEFPDEYSPYEPTPAVWSAVRDHQNLVWQRTLELLDIVSPKHIDPVFVEMIYEEYFASWAVRSNHSHENFMKFLESKAELDADTDRLVTRAIDSKIRPNECLQLLVTCPDLPSIEMAALYHPYGARGQHREPMRMDVQGAVIDHGGTLVTGDSSARSIHVHPHYIGIPGSTSSEYELAGSIVTYKKDVGSIQKADGRIVKVVERSVVALLHDSAYGFDATVLHKIDNVDYRQHWRGQDKDWIQNQLVQQSGLHYYATKLIANQSSLDCIVPLSTTYFAYQELVE
ncbi:MAG: hypothetical protein ABIR91_01445 [Candidatus Saccharimonadales bacterium]